MGERAADGFGVAGLVGRADELAVLTSFLDAARAGGGALLLTGEPGVGKSALLDASVRTARANGMRVVRGSGAEYESEIGFAVLHQLVHQLSGELERLPAANRRALEVALGLVEGTAPARIAVLSAALSLLVEAASEQPLLVVVDDLHVVDQPSAAAIAFVARRVTGHGIGVLAATRSGPDGDLRPTGLPELDVAPLRQADALRLLTRRFAHLPRRLLSSVADDARGNPLALLEFAGAATPSRERSSPTGCPAGVVTTLFDGRVRRLPRRTRDLLLLAALERSGDRRVLRAAGGRDVLDGLAPAERDHLVILDEAGDLRFRHPLVRSAVVEGSTAEERRSAHRRLADALVDQPERRAVHLAKATTAPDEESAAVLESAAQSLLRRGDPVGAVTMLRRSAELSPDPGCADRRRSQAAYVAAWMSGAPETSDALLAELGADPTRQPLAATSAAALLLVAREGDAGTAFAMLAPAIASAASSEGADPAELDDALFTLALIAHYLADAACWDQLLALLPLLPDHRPGSAAALAPFFHDVGAASDELLRGVDEEIAAVADQPDTAAVVRTALVASMTDRLAGCREAVERLAGRDSPPGSRMPGLIFLAMDQLYAGRLAAAADSAAELVALAESTGYLLWAQVGRYAAAMAAALRGDLEACRHHAEQMWAWSVHRGLQHVSKCAHFSMARAALGAGDFETAYRHAVQVSGPGVAPRFGPETVWATPDLVESALRTGRGDEARELAAALRGAGLGRVSPRLALIGSLSDAMVADPEEATQIFDRALALPGVDRWPFDLARTRLSYGEHLRRQGRARDARTHLDAARLVFAEIGALSWERRATAELRATGMTRAPAGTLGTSLTPQELEVALLAATGLSNPEIGRRLFLSPRTVSSHLYRAFPKLGITSRAALRDALDGLDGLDAQDGRPAGTDVG